MTITHHPHDTTLAAYSGNGLDAGQRLVVGIHVAGCPLCQGAVHGFTSLAGRWLDEIEPIPMSADALPMALAQLDTAEQLPAPGSTQPTSENFHGFPMGAWRWLGPGVRTRAINVAPDKGSRVFLLEAQPGTRLPHHKHVGTEWTYVVEGAFTYDSQRFAPGDFDEADESVEHVPMVEDGAVCVCLVAMQGHIQLQGFIGRLLQPFVRF
jgi:putative transcriptional regulator